MNSKKFYQMSVVCLLLLPCSFASAARWGDKAYCEVNRFGITQSTWSGEVVKSTRGETVQLVRDGSSMRGTSSIDLGDGVRVDLKIEFATGWTSHDLSVYAALIHGKELLGSGYLTRNSMDNFIGALTVEDRILSGSAQGKLILAGVPFDGSSLGYSTARDAIARGVIGENEDLGAHVKCQIEKLQSTLGQVYETLSRVRGT